MKYSAAGPSVPFAPFSDHEVDVRAAARSKETQMDVGFIGLGQMGSAIALNLVKAGHRVIVYNRTRAKAEALASRAPRSRKTLRTPAAAPW